MEFQIIVCPYVHFFHKSLYTHTQFLGTPKNCPWNIIYRVISLDLLFNRIKLWKLNGTPIKYHPFELSHTNSMRIYSSGKLWNCVSFTTATSSESHSCQHKSLRVCVFVLFFVLFSLFHSSNRKFHKVINASVWKKLIKFG